MPTKIFVILLFIISSISAKDFCMILFSTKIVYPKDKKLFLQKFPEGIIKKKSNSPYYTFRLENFKSYKDAFQRLKEIKKNYKDAFIVNCESSKQTKQNRINTINIKPNPIKSINDTKKKDDNKKIYFKDFNISHPLSLEETSLINKVYHLPISPKQVSLISNKPKLKEPKILLKYQIPNPNRTDIAQLYDILSFKRYINRLFEFNDKSEEAFYQKKIDYILSEIKRDIYNFDVYIEGYARTGKNIQKGINGNKTNNEYTNIGITLNANKKIYDGQYPLLHNSYKILNERLANIKELNAKEKLAVLGISIYTTLYISQEELKETKQILKKHKRVYEIIKERYKKGTKSILDYIDSKNDFINIQRTVSDLEYAYIHNDYILRHSIKSKSKKPYKLIPAKIDIDLNSLVNLQKKALKNSSDIAIESNILKLKKTDLLSQKERYKPTIDFDSYLGYGLNNESVFNLGNSYKGSFWQVELTFKLPIYNRNDIIDNIEKERYNALKQKRILSSKQREILILVDKTYNEIMRLKQQKYYLKELIKLAKKKIEIAQERYLNGISSYRDYSDAINNFLNYKKQFLQIEQSSIKELSILSILTGKRDFYE